MLFRFVEPDSGFKEDTFGTPIGCRHADGTNAVCIRSVSCLSALTDNRQTYRNPTKSTKSLLFTHRTPTAYLRNTYKMDYRMKYMQRREMTK